MFKFVAFDMLETRCFLKTDLLAVEIGCSRMLASDEYMHTSSMLAPSFRDLQLLHCWHTGLFVVLSHSCSGGGPAMGPCSTMSDSLVSHFRYIE